MGLAHSSFLHCTATLLFRKNYGFALSYNTSSDSIAELFYVYFVFQNQYEQERSRIGFRKYGYKLRNYEAESYR